MPTAVNERYYSAAEVAKHQGKGDLWVSFEGSVYDVSSFVDDHPGGVELLWEQAGRDITEAFRNGLHVHSGYARQLLADYRIGRLASSEREELPRPAQLTPREPMAPSKEATSFPPRAPPKKRSPEEMTDALLSRRDDTFLDLSKPLMPQVWAAQWSKNYYLEQVHIPRATNGSPRFFSSPLLEMFTKTPWYGVLLVWLPVIGGLVGFAAGTLSVGWLVHLVIDGAVLWTAYEYVFHRFLFHMDVRLPDHKLAMTAHFLMHGVHHFLPLDRYRLVMPPLMLSVLATPVGVVWSLVLGPAQAAALMTGSFLGYLAYDMIHYYSHHGLYMNSYLRRMKTYHMDHHYVDPGAGFGVSSVVWDAVLNTLLPFRTR